MMPIIQGADNAKSSRTPTSVPHACSRLSREHGSGGCDDVDENDEEDDEDEDDEEDEEEDEEDEEDEDDEDDDKSIGSADVVLAIECTHDDAPQCASVLCTAKKLNSAFQYVRRNVCRTRRAAASNSTSTSASASSFVAIVVVVAVVVGGSDDQGGPRKYSLTPGTTTAGVRMVDSPLPPPPSPL